MPIGYMLCEGGQDTILKYKVGILLQFGSAFRFAENQEATEQEGLTTPSNPV